MKNLLPIVLLIIFSCTTKVKESSKIVANYDTQKIDSLVLCINNSASNKVKIDIGENKKVSFFLQKPRNFIVSSEVVLLNFYEIFQENEIKFNTYSLYDEYNSKINYFSDKELHTFLELKSQTDSLFNKIKINDTTNLELYFSKQNFNQLDIKIFVNIIKKELNNKTPKFVGFESFNVDIGCFLNIYYKLNNNNFLIIFTKENEKFKIYKLLTSESVLIS
jgi:hypothetical protein